MKTNKLAQFNDLIERLHQIYKIITIIKFLDLHTKYIANKNVFF
jgi:hypothetical protein